LTPPHRPIPVIAPDVDSDSSDDEYDVGSDSHTITKILLTNQLVIQEDKSPLTPHLLNYFTVAVDRFHVDSIHGTYHIPFLPRTRCTPTTLTLLDTLKDMEKDNERVEDLCT
jgi:hypothetical protein